ncbi:MAG: hypothetical protein ACTSUL_05335, partial [Promethearchaeota archaeon]
VDVDTILRMINNDDESIENIQDDDSDSLDLSYKIDELINKPFLNKEKIDNHILIQIVKKWNLMRIFLMKKRKIKRITVKNHF